MGIGSMVRRMVAGVLASVVMAGAAMASEEEAAAALNRALASGMAMLVETVNGPETLERKSGAISAAATQARNDSEAVGLHA